MKGYEILAEIPCEYGVITYEGVHLTGIVEKPDYLICSDGYARLRNRQGDIVEKKPLHSDLTAR